VLERLEALYQQRNGCDVEAERELTTTRTLDPAEEVRFNPQAKGEAKRNAEDALRRAPPA
jgi:hypothetical protein